jgi:hypothetical protein
VHVTRGDRDYVDVMVGTALRHQTIYGTAGHLYWDATELAWTPANRLRVGDRLQTSSGGTLAITRLHAHRARMTTFNLGIGTLHTYFVLAGSTPVLVHNCEIFSNQMSGSLAEELETAEQLNVRPVVPGTPAFDSAIEEGPVKWAVLGNGTLVIQPKFVQGTEIAHSVLSGGADVQAAGEADIAGSASDGYFGLRLSNHSGHYEPSEESMRGVGRSAFSEAGIEFGEGSLDSWAGE